MKRLLLPVAAAAALFGAATAQAANPHFIRTTAAIEADGDLTASFKMAGLGDNETITIVLSADATATYACKNNGNNFPSDPKKRTVAGPVSAAGEFTSGQNGQVTGSLTVSPPPSGGLDCPGNQREVLAVVSYTDVSLSGGGDTAPIAGTFTKVLEPKFPG